MQVREAHLADATGIAHVHIDTWRTAYRNIVPDVVLEKWSYERSIAQWTTLFDKPERKDFVYVAENASQQIVGFASGGPALDTSDYRYRGELFTLYILDAYQRQGIGQQLFLQVVERLLSMELSSMLIWVLAENPARNFYEKLGGQLLKTGSYETEGATLKQVAYGWADITGLVSSQ